MIKKPTVHFKSGFTLLETVIYIGISGLILVGMIASMYPLLQSTEETAHKVLINNESLFVMRKISWLISNSASIQIPAEGNRANVLQIKSNSEDIYTVTEKSGSITLSKNTAPILPLTNQRVFIENFSVSRESGKIRVEFDANKKHQGPIEFLLHPQ